jgi:hypothetical protein
VRLDTKAAALDAEIDRSVYKLYALTPDEIGAIETVVAGLVSPP